MHLVPSLKTSTQLRTSYKDLTPHTAEDTPPVSLMCIEALFIKILMKMGEAHTNLGKDVTLPCALNVSQVTYCNYTGTKSRDTLQDRAAAYCACIISRRLYGLCTQSILQNALQLSITGMYQQLGKEHILKYTLNLLLPYLESCTKTNVSVKTIAVSQAYLHKSFHLFSL